ncbi:MAG: cysteine--tRNA ligase [Streptococcaceae bacterium]|jgi:cysteinyl-tRNA synthetase|nr:cysteine--tRNA ligase [Streptococcaceae bacterium]
MKIYNTYTRQLEEFQPIEPGKVRMYVCGPTVYNYIHIGNARSVVAFDVVRRYLEYRGYDVHYVSNFTDVDDKIIQAATDEGVAPRIITERYIKAFYEDIDALGVKRATENPRATEFIPQMIAFVEQLIADDFAYESAGDVYFRVSKAQDYAKLAGKNLDELLEGASGRLDDAEMARKESPADFALWKSVTDGTPEANAQGGSTSALADENERSEHDAKASVGTEELIKEGLAFPSPWGQGRPGWHLECSVMSGSLLGETLDIHGGGEDLEFPHHTNEIAQSEAYHHGVKFVNTWMHNGFVNIAGEKMSKSLGNFKTVHEMFENNQIRSEHLRFFLASTHYRRALDFTDDNIELAANNLSKLLAGGVTLAYNVRLHSRKGLPEPNDDIMNEFNKFQEQFIETMDEDFNIANGLTVFYSFISWTHKLSEFEVSQKMLDYYFQILEIILGTRKFLDDDPEIDALVAEYDVVRAAKDYARADAIRDELKTRGIVLETTKNGTRWRRG